MGSFVTYEKPFTRRWFKAYGNIVIGTFILSLGYVFFITPHKIVPGGVYGISIVIHHTFGLPVGMTALMFNVPLMLLGMRILGPRFGAKTITGFLLTAFFVDILGYYSNYEPIVHGDDLLASIFGGLLMGVGVGFIFKARASSGGTDVIASILEKYTRIPLGQLMILVDSVIVFVGLIAFGDWKIPLYSWIVIFIMGRVIDVVMQGLSDNRTLFIISDKKEEIRKKILEDLNRGGTFICGEGMFNGQPKKIIFTSVSRREMAILQDYITQIDPNAFVTVVEASEILGKGFKSLQEK